MIYKLLSHNMKNFMKIEYFLLLVVIFTATFALHAKTSAYGGCEQYGFMAYEFGGSCKCSSGYAFGKDILGNTACVSVDQMCKDQYGFNATSDYLTDKCKCNYGYSFGKDIFGKTSCVSTDQLCRDQIGYGARYNSLYDKCECGYGDIIKNGKCTNADLYCSSEHGLYSSYNDALNQCECDSGYTLDKSLQCVKKQNNVYFTVKELDTDNKRAIIKSDYDYSYYSIEYNSGCYASSFRRYLNHQIVVNLGTDYYLDTWDKIVLQDDDETCDITRREKVDSSFSLEEKDDGELTAEQLILINKLNQQTKASNQAQPTPPIKHKLTPPKVKSDTKKVDTKIKPESKKVDVSVKNNASTNSDTEKKNAPTPEPVKKLKWYQKMFNWFK